MNWHKQNRIVFYISLILVCTQGNSLFGDWKIDLSRRSKDIGIQNYVEVIPKEEKKKVYEYLYSNKYPIQDLVILNTNKGFIPSSIRLKAGLQYRVYVVNTDQKMKNSSFVLSKFSQYHSTYFGKEKSFLLRPKDEGVFQFESPETKNIGQLVVYKDPSVSVPKPVIKSKRPKFIQRVKSTVIRGLSSVNDKPKDEGLEQ